MYRIISSINAHYGGHDLVTYVLETPIQADVLNLGGMAYMLPKYEMQMVSPGNAWGPDVRP